MVQKHSRKDNLPISSAHRFHGISFAALPVVEIAYQIDLRSIRSPLTENPVSLSVTVHAIENMVIDTLAERAFDRELLLGLKNHLMPPVNDILEWFQPLVRIVNHYFLLRAHIVSH